MCLKLSVLVVDDINESRLERNAVSFHDANVEAYINDGKYTSVYDGNNFKNKNLPDEIDLLLLHNNSVAAWEKLGISSRVTIKYTGGDPPQNKFLEEHWIRQRSIKRKSDAVTKNEAEQIIKWIINRCSEEYLPNLLKPPQTKELITSIFIFCMGYLSAGVGAGEINDEEVKILIGWNDQVKEISPNTEADWKAGWETVKNPQWWDDLEKIDNLKEKVRIEMDGNLDENLEKLIYFIKGKGTIEHFETVKTVLKMLKEKI